MKRRGIFITSILFIFLLLIGCAAQTNLKDYKPKSPDEEAIIKVLIKVQDAWNKGDSNEFLAAYHDNGKISYWIGATGRNSLSKEDFAKVFPQQSSTWGYRYINPKITITGDKAVVKVYNTEVTTGNTMTYYMVKNGSWSIMSDN
jgi:hypothetical protein